MYRLSAGLCGSFWVLSPHLWKLFLLNLGIFVSLYTMLCRMLGSAFTGLLEMLSVGLFFCVDSALESRFLLDDLFSLLVVSQMARSSPAFVSALLPVLFVDIRMLLSEIAVQH